MAVITEPINHEIFQQLKGVVDFYYWKKLLCARAYPKVVNQPGTPAQRITWIGFKQSLSYFELLTQEDKKAYRKLAGGSHFTWRDLYTKVFLKGYWKLKGVPPVLFNTNVRNDKGKLKICSRPTEATALRVCYSHVAEGSAVMPWRWVPTIEGDPPPNCSLKMKLLEHWDHEYETGVFPEGQQSCEYCASDIQTGLVYVTIKVIGGEYGSVLFRTGTWRLAF